MSVWKSSVVAMQPRRPAVPPLPIAPGATPYEWSRRFGALPYQTALRLIGRYLDEHGARNINLVEIPNGFQVRYCGDDPRETKLREFTHQELAAADAQLAADRRKGARAAEPDHPDSYADYFRALGYELQRLKAYSITLDELDESLVVSYQFQDPRIALHWRKTAAMVTREERSAILQAAHSRRQPLPPRWGFWRG